jgi:putative ABC transport system permease protein
MTTLRPSFIALARSQTLRDLRAGELRLLVLAVVLAVAALSAVGFFADRLKAGLTRDARQLLGGDAVLTSDHAIAPPWLRDAHALGLQTATSETFLSMGRAPDAKGGAARLVAVKAVSASYPLRGAMQLRRTVDGPIDAVRSGPAGGTAWVDAAVLSALALQPGDALLLGDATLRIVRVIAIEPDRGTGFQALAPRVMISEADLAATGLVQPGSRVSYRLAVAAPDEGHQAQVARFVQAVQSQIRSGALRGASVESFETGRPEMRQTLDRAHQFLNLVALLAALLAAVAVAIAARDFASRHLDDCAVLRVLGAPQRTIVAVFLAEFGAVGLTASVFGVALGWLVHLGFVQLLAGLVQTTLPPPGAWPALFGLGVGLTLLLGFGLPPVLQLAQVPALRVMRREVGAPKAASLGVLLAAALGFAALLLAASSDLKLGAIAVGGFAGAMLAFALLGALAVALLRRAVPEARAPRWLVLATRQIAARPAFAVLQVAALSVGLLALVLLVLLRTDLIASWRQATPPDAPNRFVINIQPDQGAAFQHALRQAGVTRYDWYPMIRGRLVAINGHPVGPASYADAQAKRLVEREFNLSTSAQLPPHNGIAAGRWVPEQPDALSVEQGLAQTLGLKLGDRLRFDIGGVAQEGRITSLRAVDWGSMRVNFFVMFPRSSLPGLPLTYITAFKAPPHAPGFDATLARQFPNITSIDVSASIAQVQQVLDQVIAAVQYLFGFTLAAGLVVLFAAVVATRTARAREFAVMRALGASARLLAQVQRAELIGVGALAGLLASVAAIAVGWALAKYVFEFSWHARPWVPLAGAVTGALLAWAAGWWGLRGVLRQPVVQTLREAGEG